MAENSRLKGSTFSLPSFKAKSIAISGWEVLPRTATLPVASPVMIRLPNRDRGAPLKIKSASSSPPTNPAEIEYRSGLDSLARVICPVPATGDKELKLSLPCPVSSERRSRYAILVRYNTSLLRLKEISKLLSWGVIKGISANSVRPETAYSSPRLVLIPFIFVEIFNVPCLNGMGKELRFNSKGLPHRGA
ncbi:hypothetical protein ES703_80504 [subsurface metagenome]